MNTSIEYFNRIIKLNLLLNLIHSILFRQFLLDEPQLHLTFNF